MQIAILGTYPPTRCGIATFTADVEQALEEAGLDVRVLVVDPDESQTPLIDAAVAYFEITGDPWADAVAERAWAWFRGDNRLCTPLGTLENGACRDGLTARGVNFNCGAESTISFHRAARAMQELRQQHTDRATITGCFG